MATPPATGHHTQAHKQATTLPAQAPLTRLVVRALEHTLSRRYEVLTQIEQLPSGSPAPDDLITTRDALSEEVETLLNQLMAVHPPCKPEAGEAEKAKKAEERVSSQVASASTR